VSERSEPHVAGRDAVVRVTDGSFGYRGQVAVEADLTVVRGEVVALVGPNGSGKTTLVKGILGLCDRLGGTVELFGGQLRDRGRVGYVPQRQQAAGPIPATVREVVSSGRLACSRLGRRLRAPDRRAVDDAIAAVGLSERAGAPVATLSGGQQRRALVARALAGRAEILFLDEPLAGVDRTSREAIADIMSGLVADGTTIVVVLHELGPLAPLITRVARLEAGAIVSDGPPDHLAAETLGHGDEDPHPADEPSRGAGLWP
jgi:zinc transport system ATP-binding protein